jgi:hypothetical protein
MLMLLSPGHTKCVLLFRDRRIGGRLLVRHWLQRAVTIEAYYHYDDFSKTLDNPLLERL